MPRRIGDLKRLTIARVDRMWGNKLSDIAGGM